MSGRVCAILLVVMAVAAASPHKLCAGMVIEPLKGFDLRRPSPGTPERFASPATFKIERGALEQSATGSQFSLVPRATQV